MAYVKSISIKTTVNKSMEYILEGEKTDELKLVSGLNVTPDADFAYAEFCSVYKQYNHKLYNKNYKSSDKKAPIKAHHFIQSFKEGEVTKEQAHEIAQKWAKETFGDKRQVLISTHVDKGHIHNHFIVNSIDYHGKKYYANKTSLKKAREISDKYCKEYNLNVIQGNQKKGVHYKEWMERKKGTSWKHNLKVNIDTIINNRGAENLEELFDHLKNLGYEIKRGKYISIKPKHATRFVRTKTLGKNYTEEKLIERIQNPHEYEEEQRLKQLKREAYYIQRQANYEQKRKQYIGIQLKYYSLSRLIVELVMKNKKTYRPYKPDVKRIAQNDIEVQKLARQINFMSDKNITSEQELYNQYEKAKQNYADHKTKVNSIADKIKDVENAIEHALYFFEHKDNPDLDLEGRTKLKTTFAYILKYKIQTREDINTLAKQLPTLEQQKTNMLDAYSDAEKNLKTFEEVMHTHEEVRRKSYVNRLCGDKTINVIEHQGEKKLHIENFKPNKNISIKLPVDKEKFIEAIKEQGYTEQEAQELIQRINDKYADKIWIEEQQEQQNQQQKNPNKKRGEYER